MRTLFLVLIVVICVAMAGWLIVLDRQNRLLWDHWDEVKRGILYRSGQLTAPQLKEAVRRYGLRTIVNLQLPGAEMVRERTLARELGVDFVNLPMPGDGFGKESQFRKILEILDDPERCPVLVHCARGTCRTGSAVAFYRFERDGWMIQDVAAEMRRQMYRDGWIPGYIYAMTKNRPNLKWQRDLVLIDQNRRGTGHPDAGKESTHAP